MAKSTLETINPVITVNAEFTKLLGENIADTYAIKRLTIKPNVPESSKFLLKEIVLPYLLKSVSNKFRILISCFIIQSIHFIE